MTASPWRFRVPAGEDPDLLGLSAEVVAPKLLGWSLVSTVDGAPTAGRIVETEAYLGPEDPASHAATTSGFTKRNRPMFGPPGTAYLYFVYGMHWCFNVVTGEEGDPQAVLIRALEPVDGLGLMVRRRDRDRDLTSGPARLCQALGLDGKLNEHPLDRPPLELHPGGLAPAEEVGVTGRVGVREARDWPLRYFVQGNPHVSEGRVEAPAPDWTPPESKESVR